MSNQVSLKEVERKAWLSTFQDGLWDLYLGLLLAAGVVSSWFSYRDLPDASRIPAYFSVIVLAGLVLWAGKRFVTQPRLGRVKFGPEREARKSKARLVIIFAVLVTAALLAFFVPRNGGGAASLPPYSGPVIVTLLLLFVFSALAYYFEFKRLYLYAVLFALQEPLGVILQEVTGTEIGFVIAPLIGAPIVLTIGLVHLVRFLRRYPPLTGTAVSGNS